MPVLVQAIVTLGGDDGWGSTNANAAALGALGAMLQPGTADAPRRRIELVTAGEPQSLEIGPGSPVAHFATAKPGGIELKLAAGGAAVIVRAETTYVPEVDGSRAAPQAQGFVVRRELLRVAAREGEPAERVDLSEPGRAVRLRMADVVEDHVQVVNPADRNYVAVVVPLAAGVEPLNPNLATAPPEAKTTGRLTMEPSYAAFLDDQVAYYYDALPRGTYDFHFRTRATTAGSFIQPAATVEMMYDGAVRGQSAGARVEAEDGILVDEVMRGVPEA